MNNQFRYFHSILVHGPMLMGLLTAQETLTLRQAVDLAQRSNPLMDAAEAAAREAEARVRQARAAYAPHVQVSESLHRSNNPAFVFSSLLGQRRLSASSLMLDSLNHPGALSNHQSQVWVEQVLFDGRQTSRRIEAARVARLMAGEDKRRNESNVILNVLRSYFAVALAEKTQEVARQSRESALADLDRALSIFRSGRSTHADVLAVRVHLAGVREQEIRASNDFAVARAALNDALGVGIERRFELTTPLESFVDVPEVEFEDYRRRAQENRPELKHAGLTHRLAHTQQQIAASVLWPQIVFQGMAGADRRAFFGRGGANWLTGVTLRWTIWNGGETQARVEQARFAESGALAMRKHIASGIELEVRRAYLDLRAAAQRIEVATTAAEEAQEAHRIVQNRHQAGLTTITELLRSETALTASRTRQLVAIYDHRIAAAGLAYASGTLTASHAVVNRDTE